MCSEPRTFGATQKSLFNMLPETLFMYVVYDASHIYIEAKRQSKKKTTKHCHIPSVPIMWHCIC